MRSPTAPAHHLPYHLLLLRPNLHAGGMVEEAEPERGGDACPLQMGVGDRGVQLAPGLQEGTAWGNARDRLPATDEFPPAVATLPAKEVRRTATEAPSSANPASNWGGKVEPVAMEHSDLACASGPDEVLRVHEALDRLAVQVPLKAGLAALRFFVGPRIAEAPEALGLFPTTAEQQSAFVRAGLFRELRCS